MSMKDWAAYIVFRNEMKYNKKDMNAVLREDEGRDGKAPCMQAKRFGE